MHGLSLQPSILDLILGGLLLLCLLRGLVRGLLPELGGLLSLLLALGAAANNTVHTAVTSFMESHLPDPGWAGVVACLAVFFGLLLVLRLFCQILEHIFSKQAPGWLDRCLGGLAGLAKGVLACTIILVCLAYIAPESNLRRDSVLEPYFNTFWHSLSSLSGGGYKLPDLFDRE